MFFPFLTVEVKFGNEALNIADRQNAHSAAVVELYRLVSRPKELHRKILAFSVSHDHHAVRIYGYYAVIKGKETLFYRHLVHDFSIISSDGKDRGKDRWTAHEFARNVYDKFYSIYHQKICSAIDLLPNPANFAVEPSRTVNLESFEQGISLLSSSYSRRTKPDPRSSQIPEPVFKKPKEKGKK